MFLLIIRDLDSFHFSPSQLGKLAEELQILLTMVGSITSASSVGLLDGKLKKKNQANKVLAVKNNRQLINKKMK